MIISGSDLPDLLRHAPPAYFHDRCDFSLLPHGLPPGLPGLSVRNLGSGPYFGMVTSLSGRQQDSFAEQREAGAAVCLVFEHLDPVEVAFDHA